MICLHHVPSSPDLSSCLLPAQHPQTSPQNTYAHTSQHPLAGLSAIAIAVGGYHTCAIATGGGVKCWGANWLGQLGIGSYDTRNEPADVSGTGTSRVDGKDRIEMSMYQNKRLSVNGHLLSERPHKCKLVPHPFLSFFNTKPLPNSM
jgi:hypothetical protein